MGSGSETLDAIRSALITAGIGVAANPSNSDWMIYEHFMEDGTPNHDRAITLYETPGEPPLQTWLITYPSLQVVVRGAADEATEVRQKQQDIYALLHCGNVELGDDFVFCFAKQSAPISMGRDEKRRPKTAWNYRMMRNTPGSNSVVDEYIKGVFTTPTPGVTSLFSVDLEQTINDFSIFNFPDMTSINFPSLTAVGGDFNTITLPVLTTLNFPLLATVGGNMDIQDIYLQPSLHLPALTSVGGELGIQGMNAVTSLDLSSLATCGNGFHLFDSAFPDLDLPALTTTGSNAFQVNGLAHLTSISAPNLLTATNTQIYDCPLLTTLALNAITSCNVIVHDNATLATISLPALAQVNFEILLHDMPLLVTLDLPSLANVGGGTIGSTTGTDALANVDLGNNLLVVGCDVVFSSCALTQASVDGILVALAALDGTGGTTSYDNHAVTLTGTSASPSATGLAAKAVLEGRGNTVTVN